MGFAAALPDHGSATREEAPVVVGLNVMAHQDPRYWRRGDRRRYEAYLAKMASFAGWLLERGYVVRVFSSQTQSDLMVTADLTTALAERGFEGHPRLDIAAERVETVNDLIEMVAGCDYMVAARYHTILLSLLTGVPVLALAYHPKTVELLARVDRADRCADIDEIEVHELTARFETMVTEDTPEERAFQRKLSLDERAAVQLQFDWQFGALRPETVRLGTLDASRDRTRTA
jgi:polysaccharide pyruvyl transferase WcaK-like protein